MKGLLTIAAVLFGLIQPVHALEFECEAGSDVRFIRLELPGIEHLCEVTVTKSDNAREVKWYANHDTRFCSDKAEELKNKYSSQWGYECKQWPDHDGVDQLNPRQRTILDAELKFIIDRGKNAANAFVVEGVKVAASQQKSSKVSTLVVQFFLHEPANGVTRDVTHVIQDDGVSWNTTSRIDSLINYVDANEGYTVNSALLSSVTDNGALEIITVLDTVDDSKSEQSTGCYGTQTLAAQSDGKVVARTPHRFICADVAAGNGAG